MPASVTMNGCSRKRWISSPARAEHRADRQHQRNARPGSTVLLLDQRGRDHRRQRDHRAHRQVDAAGQDHEGHADRDDAQERVVDQQVQEHLRREEAAGRATRREANSDTQTTAVGRAAACVLGQPSVGRCDAVVRRAPAPRRTSHERCRTSREPLADCSSITTNTTAALTTRSISRRHAERIDRRRQRLDDQRADHVPARLNRPPVSAVPPRATARIASSSRAARRCCRRRS